MDFDVFLSHNSKDKKAVRALAQQLKHRGIQVWLDEDQLIPGRNWQSLLEQGIEQSATGAVLVGEDGLGPWEDEEMQALLRHAAANGKPVIPVLLPGALKEPRLPLFLANRKWVDLRGGLTDQGIAALIWGIRGERIEAPPGAPDVTAGPSRAQRRAISSGRRLVVVGMVGLVCAILAIYFLAGPWNQQTSGTLDEEEFTIWTISEEDDKLTRERHTLAQADMASRRPSDNFDRLLESSLAAGGNRAEVRIFRLDDGGELTAQQGDPLAGGNRGVLVVPESLVARFPDAHAALTYLRSQLPSD